MSYETRFISKELRTETSFDTIQDKEVSFGCSRNSEKASFGVSVEPKLTNLEAQQDMLDNIKPGRVSYKTRFISKEPKTALETIRNKENSF